MKLHLSLSVDVDVEEIEYMDACCRIRDVTTTWLANEIMRSVLREQLVLAVLDDDSKKADRKLGQQGYRPSRLLADTGIGAKPIAPRSQMSKSDMRKMLEDAAANTAALSTEKLEPSQTRRVIAPDDVECSSPPAAAEAAPATDDDAPISRRKKYGLADYPL